MTQNKDKENKKQVLICKFNSCSDERMHYSALIWQIPTIAIGILAFLVSAYLQNSVTVCQKIFVASISILLMVVTILVLIKYRFFANARTQDLREIQKEFKKLGIDVREIVWQTKRIICKTEQYPNVSRNLLTRLSAYEVLMVTLVLIFIGMIIFFSYDLLPLLC